MKVYLFGYAGYTSAQLEKAANALGAVVVDIRFSSRSRNPQWSGLTLWRLFGDERYLHVPQLGNVNYKNGGEIKIFNLDLGVRRMCRFMEERGAAAAILVCGCKDAAGCHRTVVGDALRAMGYEVQELAEAGYV